jgi:hypothetical protein
MYPGHYSVPGAIPSCTFRRDLPNVVHVEELTSALYLDKPSDVGQYAIVMNDLSTRSATPAGLRRALPPAGGRAAGGVTRCVSSLAARPQA